MPFFERCLELLFCMQLSSNFWFGRRPVLSTCGYIRHVKTSILRMPKNGPSIFRSKLKLTEPDGSVENSRKEQVVYNQYSDWRSKDFYIQIIQYGFEDFVIFFRIPILRFFSFCSVFYHNFCDLEGALFAGMQNLGSALRDIRLSSWNIQFCWT